jgi:hypothetical protein
MPDGPISDALLRTDVFGHAGLTEADLDLVARLRQQPTPDRSPGETVQLGAALVQKLVRTLAPPAGA